MTREISLHPELNRGLDDPPELDRAWFHGHPKAITRIRPLMPDELDALNAVLKAMGCEGWGVLEFIDRDGPRPTTHVAVVDLLRLNQQPHGPDGESVRFRLPCPEPDCPELERTIIREAIKTAGVLYGRLRRSTRRKPKWGFA